MAHQRSRLPPDGPPSQGNAALNSMLGQLHSRVKDLESKNKSLEIEKQKFAQEVRRLSRSNPEKSLVFSAPFSRDGSNNRGSRSAQGIQGIQYPLDHKFATPMATPLPENQRTGSPLDPRISPDAFISEVIGEESLPQNPKVKQKLTDLTSLMSEKLAEVGDLRKSETESKAKLEYSRRTIASLLQFLSILHSICLSSGGMTDEGLPSWLGLILDSSMLGSSSFEIGRLWRVLQYNLSHCHDRKPSVLTQGVVDDWYHRLPKDLQPGKHDVKRTLAKLYAEVCAFSNISEEEEGLATSILVDMENSSGDSGSADSSLSSRIPAQDLMTFKSIMQGLVEKFEDLYNQITQLKSMVDQDSETADEMENDMYLPQREALENYDLGRLIQTMNQVIETLSYKLKVVSSQRRLCHRCHQDISLDSGQEMKASQQSFGLHSKEVMPDIQQPPFPGQSHLASGALPKISGRPSTSTFYGVSGPLPPRTLTVLQNSVALVTSQSDVTPVNHRKNELAESMRIRPSSLDSAMASKRPSPSQRSTVPLDHYSPRSKTFLESDSDDEYEIRGPPDTPPEVRAMHFMQGGRPSSATAVGKVSGTLGPVRSTTAPIYPGGHYHQKSDDSGLDLSTPGFLAGQLQKSSLEQLETHAPTEGLRLPYSQVQQCTGDNSDTIQDMLLPSSVEWSTVQLKGGGIKPPTPKVMDRYSSAMIMAKQSIQDLRCVICNKTFPAESRGVIYEHIQEHLNPGTSASPESSLVTLTGAEIGRWDVPDAKDTDEVEDTLGKCPVCNTEFPSYVTLKARESHINLHFEDEPGFEVVADQYNLKK